MIDFHCHLDLYPDPGSIITELILRKTYVLAVTTTPKAFAGNLKLTAGSERIRLAVGLHPEVIRERHKEVDLVCQLMSQTRYVGEVGLDGSPDYKDCFPTQQKVLRCILSECRNQGGKIVSLHSRMAATAVLEEIDHAGNIGTPVLHWFSGSEEELERAIRLECWFSVGPLMLAGKRGRHLANLIPRDRILPETDGPFAQRKGKPLFPWDSDQVLPGLAEIWGEELDMVKNQMWTNFKTILAQ